MQCSDNTLAVKSVKSGHLKQTATLFSRVADGHIWITRTKSWSIETEAGSVETQITRYRSDLSCSAFRRQGGARVEPNLAVVEPAKPCAAAVERGTRHSLILVELIWLVWSDVVNPQNVIDGGTTVEHEKNSKFKKLRAFSVYLYLNISH